MIVSFEWDIVHNKVTRYGSTNPVLPTGAGPFTVEEVRDLVHPDDRWLFMANIQKAIDTPDGRYQSEFRYVLPDRRIAWASEFGYVEHDSEGRALKLIGLSQDITESKLTFQALHEERDRLRVLLNSMSDEVWLADTRQEITFANPSALQSFNLRSADSHINVRDLVASLEVFRPDGTPRPTSESPVFRALRGEQVSKEEEVVRMPVSGELRYRQVSSSPIHNPEGEIIASVSVVRDVSEEKRMEQQLRAAKEEAERADRAKTRFLAAASHDLRQPLSAIKLYAGILKGHVAPGGLPLLEKMTECIGSMSELLEDLLDLSKLEAGVVVPTKRNFALTEILEPLLCAHAPEANLKGVRLYCRPSTWVIHTDPILLRRILDNIVSNAIRFTEHGGVLLGCRRHAGKTWLEVWDTGIGIPPEKTGEIFEEFKQVDEARTRGSGLGLAIVARKAALLGLAIRVRSRLGRGSMFAVELPPGDAQSVTRAPVQQAAFYRTLHIALVEDNSAVRDALVLSLQEAGHSVTAAATAGELLGKLQATPDILVTDYRLPHGETGFDVIVAVRAQFRELPAILVTGDTNPRLVREMAERGLVVLHKPVDLETLLAYLEDMTGTVAVSA